MENNWNHNNITSIDNDLDMRVYSSRLIGQESDLVLHGGGNTSVKSTTENVFKETQDIIWVKASGYDLATMGREGYTGLLLEPLLRLAELDELSDLDMVNEVKRARLNSDSANPSVEAIVHAIMPYKYIDHSHPNAVLTISNTPEGVELINEIYGSRILHLPYVKPGFDLARQIRAALAEHDFGQYQGVVLQHHGVFTYSDCAEESYSNMIEIVNDAEQYLKNKYGVIKPLNDLELDSIQLSRTRNYMSKIAGFPLLSLPIETIPEEQVSNVSSLSRNGTLTPEHVIHNKPFPVTISSKPESDIEEFKKEYQKYYSNNNNSETTILPQHPHWAIFKQGQVRSFGSTLKRCQVSGDVGSATLKALRYASNIGGWRGLTEHQLYEIEYWELEQAKIKHNKNPQNLTGRIALVTGAAAGIGKACAKVLNDEGSIVVGLDINPTIKQLMCRDDFVGYEVDITKEKDVKSVINKVIQRFGGLDMLVSNAGIFKSGQTVEKLDDDVWDSTLDVNLTSHYKLVKHAIPFLRYGIDPGIVFIGSRNFHAPGAGASAYSVSKAGLTQLMRVLALELASEGITVNAIHPDAVFDTNLWTSEALENSARRYGITVEEYKTRNLLQTEVTSKDVGLATLAFLNGTLRKTTGAQLPVDGGNDRII